MDAPSNRFEVQARKSLGQWLIPKSLGVNPRPKFPDDHMDAHRQQNRKIQYPGVVQLVARVVWEDGCGVRPLWPAGPEAIGAVASSEIFRR